MVYTIMKCVTFHTTL